MNPDLAVTDGSLYLTWDLSPRLAARMALARADPATGRIVAENEFSPGAVSVPVYAAGWLWVTDMTPAGELLLRLDPRSLIVTGELKVADGAQAGGQDDRIAFAGGSIWVDGLDRLVRVAPQTVRPQRVIALPHANSSTAGASPDGRTLIVSEADSGAATIQRRDPRTGTMLASSKTVLGVSAPLIGGVTGDVAWIAEPTGTMGYIERFQTAAMTPAAATLVEGTNAIRAGIWDGLLWVHGPDGATMTNYCADPVTGQRLASLAMPYHSHPVLLAVHGEDLYYSYLLPDGSRSRIAVTPIPAACLRAR